MLFRSRGHATFSVTYPTSPVADNMTGAARFQALGAISVQLTNVFRATRSLPRQWVRRRLPALAVALLLSPPAMGDARDSLTIGITQFPSTLNPNIDAMAAKSYVLGMALRPFTVYDADWQLVCLLCVTLPSIENGLAVPVDLADGKKGVELTYTIGADAMWGDGMPVTTDDVLFTYEVGRNPQSAVGNAE